MTLPDDRLPVLLVIIEVGDVLMIMMVIMMTMMVMMRSYLMTDSSCTC